MKQTWISHIDGPMKDISSNHTETAVTGNNKYTVSCGVLQCCNITFVHKVAVLSHYSLQNHATDTVMKLK